MPELTEERIAQICQNAAVNAVEEFARAHPCRLNDHERGVVHALSDAIVEEKANHGTLRIIVQIGKSYQDITGSIRRFGMWVIVAVIVFFGVKLGPDIWRFFRP